MYQSIHHVKQIVKSEIKEINDGYSMKITVIYDELGTCKESYSDNTMHGWMELETQLTLFAETKEALEFKAKALA